MNDNDMTSAGWLSLPEVAEAIGVELRDVRSMVRESRLAGVRRGESNAYAVPAEFIRTKEEDPEEPGPLPALRGTLITLGDSGYSEEEAVRWLLRPDDTLGVPPVQALRAGQIHAVRRIAQALAF
ncbi:Rv2175c family DNA-binding protein [Georgenia wangjunii]|uniref:Rv2175c family DNA-binding protein n=1 Tax=Georgenia wangjunii TaxID=3117730 RepID=UPI002F268BEF